MAVKVELVNSLQDRENNECLAAIALQGMLSSSFSEDINGHIGIAYGLTLSGQDPRDIDILLFGQLENYTLPNYYTRDPQYPKQNLKIDNFCIAIELKEHTYSGIRLNATHVEVKYNEKWKDATEQNEKQRYSCKNYLEKELGYNVYTTNLLWLKGLTREQFNSMTGNNSIGALPAEFTFDEIVALMINQGAFIAYDRVLRCNRMIVNFDFILHPNDNFFTDISKCLFKERLPVSGLTRKKLEVLQQIEANENLTTEQGIFTVLKGRAGTGKTFHLIQSALNLANEDTGKRCLILTYNYALVSDIRRLLHFMEIPDGIDNYTVQIQTLHSFFMGLMRTLNIASVNNIRHTNFERSYESSLYELNTCVNKVMNESGIQILKSDNHFAIDWDYILVDEAQDWMEVEKNVLFKIYGKDNIIVADGVDQFMRGNQYLPWARGLDNVNKIDLKVGMRQKTNLVNFANRFASKVGLSWSVDSNNRNEWAGGRIIIVNQYTSDLHKELLEDCINAGGDAYDILCLIPYQMAPSSNGTKAITPINIETWHTSGISLFDGTKRDERIGYTEQYSTDVNECRLYQYDSCRGLEGWVTVCFKLDVLIANKMRLANDMEFQEPLQLMSRDALIREYVYKWVMMPLTRAIDTLVITLHDVDSEVGKILQELAENTDYIDWQ